MVLSQDVSLPEGLKVTLVASSDEASEKEAWAALAGQDRVENREAWLALSAERERAICDNPIDAEDWDNWEPPRPRGWKSGSSRHGKA